MQCFNRSLIPKLGAAFVVLVALLVLVGCEQQNNDEVATVSGELVPLAGPDWLVVNYWAEWCGPCRHEIPELNELDGQPVSQVAAGESGQRASGPKVTVLGVNYDGLQDAKLSQVRVRMQIDFGVLAQDPRMRWEQELPTVLPSTYLIAPGGEFVETLVGPQTRAGILSRIETLQAQRTSDT